MHAQLRSVALLNASTAAADCEVACAAHERDQPNL